MDLKKIINSEEYMIFGCSIMISGCICFILAYLIGFIGTLITPRIYFSDIISSTIQMLLVVVILFLVVEKYNIHRRLLEKKKKEKIKN